MEIDPPDSGAGRDLVTMIQRGDVNKMSFGFRTLKDVWERVDKGDGSKPEEIRTLLKVRLFDVSPVTFPAYPQTDIAARSRDLWEKSRGPSQALLAANSRKRALDLLERDGSY